MPAIKVLSPAKLNLTFAIQGLLGDGYHKVETLLQAVDLFDELILTIEPGSAFQVTIQGEGDHFPKDETNLIARAARLFQERIVSEQPFALCAELKKRIPVGAGLGGGSSNAAACLVALNHFFSYPATQDKLKELGAELGADVPFLIEGGTAIGRHRGDILQAVESRLELYFCIVKPRLLSVSTPWAYRQFDSYEGEVAGGDLPLAVEAMQEGNLSLALKSFGNVFEPVVFAQFPQLARLKQTLVDFGCLACHLSGSGPALYAVVADGKQAEAVGLYLEQSGADLFVADGSASDDRQQPLEFFIAGSLESGVRIIQPTSATS